MYPAPVANCQRNLLNTVTTTEGSEMLFYSLGLRYSSKMCIFSILSLNVHPVSHSLQADKIFYYNAKDDVSITSTILIFSQCY